MFTNRIDKENSNPNFQNTLLQRPSPNKAAGARPTVISSNALIHASTRNSRMFKAIVSHNFAFSSFSPTTLSIYYIIKTIEKER